MPLSGVPLTRTDPLVGTTTFIRDAFNRRTVETDPNGVATETLYDPLDRVRHTIQRSAGSAPGTWPPAAADLVTEHVNNALGDLALTILPRGNVVAYERDPAGRLVAIERPDAVTPAARLLYTLDAAGNRVREERQRWQGAGWATLAETAVRHPLPPRPHRRGPTRPRRLAQLGAE